MKSANIYKQSVYDHRSILIHMSVVNDGSLNVKNYYKLINNIRQQFDIIKVHSLTNDGDECIHKKIYFNFKTEYLMKDKQWENFQLHHKAVGLMFIGEFKSGTELQNILKVYETEKDKGVGSVIESRLVLVYDENNEGLVNSIRQSLLWHDELSSSGESEEANNYQSESTGVDCKEELSYIKESLLQSDIIWYQKSLISSQHYGSTSSLTDSCSSTNSTHCTINSFNSDILSSPSLIESPQIDPGLSVVDNSRKSREIYLFLKNIYEKLSTSLSNRVTALTNKTEQSLQSKSSNMETSSDSGSTLSLDDADFNLSDPLDIDRKRFQEEHRFNKTSKSRHYLGRLAKQTGDYALICGNYWQSYHYYQIAICYLKKYNSDQLWLAGAEEGLCCAWISYNFDTNLHSFDSDRVDSLLTHCRQSFLNQMKVSLNQQQQQQQQSQSTDIVSATVTNSDQIDFSFLKKTFSLNDAFKSPPEIQNLDELSEKYLSAINRYRKVLKSKTENGVRSVNLDSCIKASRFFIDRHRYLEASNFLKLIKSDLTSIDTDLSKYHKTLSKLYSQMGFIRKAIVHKYQSILLINATLDTLALKQKLTTTINNTQLNRQKLLGKKLKIVVEILKNFEIDTFPLFNDNNIIIDTNGTCVINILDNVNCTQFEPLKFKMALELFHVCRALNRNSNILLAIGLSLLDNWHRLLTAGDCSRLLSDLGTLCQSLPADSSHNGSSRRLLLCCRVSSLPRLKRLIVTPLAPYLSPREVVKTPLEAKSVFIYTPLTVHSSHKMTPLLPVEWVCGEECELVLQFDNVLPVPLQLSSVEFLLTNSSSCSGTEQEHSVWVPAEGGAVHLLPCSAKQVHCHFVLIPSSDLLVALASGSHYTITNVAYQLVSLPSVVFQPQRTVLEHVKCPPITIRPMMAQMRILTSIPDCSSLPPSPLLSPTHCPQATAPANTVLSSTISIYDNELLDFTLFLSNESKELNITRVTCVLDELYLSSVSNMLISRIADDEYNNRQQSQHRMLSLFHQDSNIFENLSIKSISSLSDSRSLTPQSASSAQHCPNLPTEAVVKFKVDLQDREFSRELFLKSSSMELWAGQFRITLRYWSEGAVDSHTSKEHQQERKEDSGSCTVYRESVYAINCTVLLGVCVIGYRLERNMSLIVTLNNFTDNKINLDVYWKGSKITLKYIVIVPNCGQISQSNHCQELKRINSTECSSHIIQYRVSSEFLDLPYLLKNNEICSEADLADYIQSNLKMTWSMKDKTLDKTRQGNVNLAMCLCKFHQHATSEFYSSRKQSIAHELTFSVFDMIKIWMWKNVTLEIQIFTQNNERNSPISNSSSLSINIMEYIQFRITCNFLEDTWASNISDEAINKMYLRCLVVPIRIPHGSNSSSEEEVIHFQNFEICGNHTLNFNRETLGDKELNGSVLFFIPGSYCVYGQLFTYDSDSENCRSKGETLEESLQYEIHVL